MQVMFNVGDPMVTGRRDTCSTSSRMRPNHFYACVVISLQFHASTSIKAGAREGSFVCISTNFIAGGSRLAAPRPL